jgi:hypothetical protein
VDIFGNSCLDGLERSISVSELLHGFLQPNAECMRPCRGIGGLGGLELVKEHANENGDEYAN